MMLRACSVLLVVVWIGVACSSDRSDSPYKQLQGESQTGSQVDPGAEPSSETPKSGTQATGQVSAPACDVKPAPLAQFAFPAVSEPWGVLDRPMPHWKGLEAPEELGRDPLEAGGMLAKSVLPSGEIVVSLAELEALVGSSAGCGALSPLGEGKRVPGHWNEFPPLVQDLGFDPPLHALAVYQDETRIFEIPRLDGQRFFTFYPEAQGRGVPIRYAVRWPKGVPEFVVLLGVELINGEALAETAELTASVQSQQLAGVERSTSVLHLDFNGDGSAEFVSYRDREQTQDCEQGDAYCDVTRTVVLTRSEGHWIATGVAKPSQDGVLGW